MIGGVPDCADRAVAPSWCTAAVLGCVLTVAGSIVMSPPAGADNKRLNDGVAVNVHTIHRQQNCSEDVAVNPQLQLAAEWHTNDVLNNRALNGDSGSDGSSVQDRANAAGIKASSPKPLRSTQRSPSAASRSSTSGTPTPPTWRSCVTAPTRKSVSGRRTVWTGRW